MAKRIMEIYFFPRSLPSIVIFWGLLLVAGVEATISVIVALTYAFLFTLVGIATDRVSNVDYGVVLFFTVGLILCLTAPTLSVDYLMSHFSTFLFSSFLAMVYVPLAFKAEPFTVAFSKRKVPKEVWHTEEFMAINRIMTVVWSGFFFLGLMITLIPGLWTQIIIPLILYGCIGLPFNKIYPGFYLRRGETKRQEARMSPMGVEKREQDTAQNPSEVRTFFERMVSRYDAEKGGDIQATYQFEITGPEAIKHYIEIKNRRCSLHDGEAREPDLVIRTPWDVWLAISRNEISGRDALLKGMYQMEGNLEYLMKMKDLFGT
jgi:hypothetical protein